MVSQVLSCNTYNCTSINQKDDLESGKSVLRSTNSCSNISQRDDFECSDRVLDTADKRCLSTISKRTDLESGKSALGKPCKSLTNDENLVIPCQKSLFDEALDSDDETITAGSAKTHHIKKKDNAPKPVKSDTSDNPWVNTGPIPIPIQHTGHASNIQMPATEFSTIPDSAELSTDPQSIAQLIAAIQNRQTTTTDAHLRRRLHDFERARNLRWEMYRAAPPWGILGMHEHLSGVRVDLRWAEQAALRRASGESYLCWTDFVKEYDSGHYHKRPIFVIALTIVCACMMVYTMYLGNWEFAPLDVNPMCGPTPETLLDAGALNGTLLIVHDQWWRLFTPLILHAGLIHFGLNMLAIWFIGRPIEKIHGSCNLSCLFIISAVGGNILSALFQPNVITVGASGGIFGLLGMCLASVFVNWDLLFLKLDEKDEKAPCRNVGVLFWLFFDVMVNVTIGLTPYVDNFAHMGGLLYGIFYALPLVDRLGIHFFGQLGFCFKLRSCSFRMFGFVAGFGLLLVSSLMLVGGDGYTNPCANCRYISCAPFPFWTEDKWWDCSPT